MSTIGDLMYSIAIGYWVYEKTGSSGLMGIMSSISLFVSMLLSPFTGSIIDKANRKWIIIGTDIIQGVLMLIIGTLAYMDKLNVPGVLVAAFLAALGSVFYSPAISTLLIDIIPHDDMVRGQSVFSGINSFVDLVGTALSGAMVAFFGVPLIVVINGLSNLYSAFSELFVCVPKTVQQGEAITVKSIMHDMKTALKEIFSNRFLRLFVPCALILNLLGAGPLSLMLPFAMEKGFSIDMYGYMMAIYTMSSLIVVLVLGAVKLKPVARFWIMALGFTFAMPFLAIAYISNSFVTVCVFIFIGALLNNAGNMIFNSALMLALPEENRGAILGFIRSASVGGVALSSVIYGVLGDIFPLYLVFLVGTALSLVPMLYMCFHHATREFMLEH